MSHDDLLSSIITSGTSLQLLVERSEGETPHIIHVGGSSGCGGGTGGTGGVATSLTQTTLVPAAFEQSVASLLVKPEEATSTSRTQSPIVSELNITCRMASSSDLIDLSVAEGITAVAEGRTAAPDKWAGRRLTLPDFKSDYAESNTDDNADADTDADVNGYHTTKRTDTNVAADYCDGTVKDDCEDDWVSTTAFRRATMQKPTEDWFVTTVLDEPTLREPTEDWLSTTAFHETTVQELTEDWFSTTVLNETKLKHPPIFEQEVTLASGTTV
jgi:hypothetical protein